jgi:hypothetical protein
MLRRPKRSKNEAAPPKEVEEFVSRVLLFYIPYQNACINNVIQSNVAQNRTALSTLLSLRYKRFFTAVCSSDIFAHHQEYLNCESVEITNKMQPCNRIYYSKVY